jgi:hypothetical protein
LPEDEQTSKHGGGGRYNVILEFRGDQTKNDEKERKKEKNVSMSKNKVNSPVL